MDNDRTHLRMDVQLLLVNIGGTQRVYRSLRKVGYLYERGRVKTAVRLALQHKPSRGIDYQS